MEDKAQTSQFELLVRSVKEYGIFMLNTDGYIQTWNAGAERLKGYTAEEIIGKHFSIFYPPEALASGFPRYELDVALKEGMFEDLGWRVRKDGTRFWANVVISAIYDEAGKHVGFSKVTRDLTDRKNAEEQLRRSEEIFRLMVSNVRDYGIFMLDTEGRVMTWNEGAERIKGYRAEEIIGEHFSKFYPESDIVSGKPEMELVEAAKTGRFEDRGWRVRKDGTFFFANVIISAVRDEQGELRGFAKVTRDLTDQKLVEEERALRFAAQAANEAKSRFLASMSHELRTPLNSIIGFTGVMLMELSGPLTGDQKKQLEAVDNSARHLLALINDILNLAKIEAGESELMMEDVPVGPLIEEIYGALKIQADAKHLAMEWRCEEGLIARADRRALKQVILNLVTNGIKFTKKGKIEIHAEKRSGNAVISVIDTGVGIEEHNLMRLFQPFGQVSNESNQEGTGLGLHLSQKLAEQMDGLIKVESTFGQGSIFSVVIPVAK